MTTYVEDFCEQEAPTTFDSVRRDIKRVATKLKEFRDGGTMPVTKDFGEVKANLTLAYRHLEDASMRIGKAIQANDGGVSVYDKETTVGA